MLFIDALNEVTRERAQSFLKPEHQQHILKTFSDFVAEDAFSAVATLDQILANGSNLSIPMYVKKLTTVIAGSGTNQLANVHEAWTQWQTNGSEFWLQMDSLVGTLDGLIEEHAK